MSWLHQRRRGRPGVLLGAAVLSWLMMALVPLGAALVPLGAALLPLSARAAERWAEVCTAQGVRWIVVAAEREADTPGTHAPAAGHGAGHCALCSAGTPPVALPPHLSFQAPAVLPAAWQAREDGPTGCAVSAWRRAPSRAPPLRA